MKNRSFGRILFFSVSSLGAIAMTPGAVRAADPIQITVLSSRPDMVTGGDALVQVDAPASALIQLNGQDVTSAFHAGTGLVSGLKLGENSLQVFTGGKAGGRPAAQLTLKNHPITGPLFSGPQEQPFACQSQDFRLPSGELLGPPVDANCSVKTIVTYVYKTIQTSLPADQAIGGMKPMLNLKKLPPDVAYTTTTAGMKVPYIVRIETGTINRGIYEFAVLSDPSKEPELGPFAPPAAWNKRLLYSFGGGCVTGWYRQGVSIGNGSVVNDDIVGKGYAEISSTLNVFGNNCNDLIAAETAAMTKERFVKAYGKPDFTFSRGGSGGSYQQLGLAGNYPGVLDGIIPSQTFPDINSTVQYLTDAQVLDHYFSKVSNDLTPAQQKAIGGGGQLASLAEGSIEGTRIDPVAYCPRQLAEDLRYDPKTNPKGVRCDTYDHAANVYGRDPATGFARRAIDNTGVQYGLAALNAGTISVTQFLDLNQNVGGLDNDDHFVPARTVADPDALRIAYQTGRVATGAGLSQIPIIDVRHLVPGGDLKPTGDHHLKFWSFALRARLRKANGTLGNEVMLVARGDASGNKVDDFAIAQMDAWLTNLSRDSSKDPVMAKIARAKPAELTDACYTNTGQRIAEPQVFGSGQCDTLYPAFPNPRMVAGGPLTNDVIKCQLKPIDMADYKVPVSDADKARLQTIFPGGVCDWSKPGVAQQNQRTWLSY